MRDHKDDACAAIEGYLLARGARYRDVREQQYGDAMDTAGFTGFPDLIADLIADLLHLHEATDSEAVDHDHASRNALDTAKRAMRRRAMHRYSADERTNR